MTRLPVREPVFENRTSMKRTHSAAGGFTLIELILVIALLAIVSTLAVNKVGGIREGSARKVSLANQKAVERAVEAYLAEDGALNRLDSLLVAGAGGAPLSRTAESGAFDFDGASRAGYLYRGPDDDTVRETRNAGLSDGLRGPLCLYVLDAGQAAALGSRLGLRFVMAGTAYPDPAFRYGRDRAWGDGTAPESSDGLDPNAAFCVATAVTNDMPVAAVNPKTNAGRAIYRACGQELLATEDDGDYDEAAVLSEVAATGGPLLAFGLGDAASIVGKADAGLENAPSAPFAKKTEYSRYILLVRLRTAAGRTIPEFAGVIDPDGNTFRAAQAVLRNL